MQVIILSGNLARDAESKTTQSGKQVCSFSVGVAQGWGDNKSTNWYRCNVWGDRGEKIAQYLLKGVKVFVTGELSIGSYEGKTQLEVRVSEVEFVSRGETRQERPAPAAEDLSDEVPF